MKLDAKIVDRLTDHFCEEFVEEVERKMGRSLTEEEWERCRDAVYSELESALEAELPLGS